MIRGRKEMERERSDGRYHICEYAYGYFERAVPLPESVAVDKAKAPRGSQPSSSFASFNVTRTISSPSGELLFVNPKTSQSLSIVRFSRSTSP